MKKTILCVGDNPASLDTLRHLLEKEFDQESEVTVATEAFETLSLIDDLLKQKKEISVVISDHYMPQMSNLELLIKCCEKLPNSRLFLIGEHFDISQLTTLLNKISLYRLISKPWSEDHLLSSVKKALYDNAPCTETLNEPAPVHFEETKKLADLGRLLAGIAHEINTPLGAINTSIMTLKESLWKCFKSILDMSQLLHEDELILFTEMIKQGVSSNQFVSTREARTKRKELLSWIENWSVSNPSWLAEKLVEMNLTEDPERFKSLLMHSSSSQIVHAAYNLIEQSKTTNNIQLATQKALTIAQALKTYARRSDASEKTGVNLQSNIETILVLYQNQIKQGIEVIKEFDEKPVVINGYPEELMQIWTNLIHNSIQAMNHHGTITIGLQADGKNATVSISDNGPGIPKDIQHKIFKPFFTTKVAGKGTGLGLDIVLKIVEKHEGKIKLESDHSGTTFHIVIPIQ